METKEHFKGLSIPECIAKYDARLKETEDDWKWPLAHSVEEAIIERVKYFDEPQSCGEDEWLVCLPFPIGKWDDEGENIVYWTAIKVEKKSYGEMMTIGRNEDDDFIEESVYGDDLIWLYKRLFCMGFFDPVYEKNFLENANMI